MVEHLKWLAAERPGLDRTVQQFIEIGGAPSIAITAERAVHLPVLRAAHGKSMRTPPASIELHHHSSKAEGGEVRVNKGRTNGQVSGFHHIGEAQGTWIDMVHQPLTGGQTTQGNGA